LTAITNQIGEKIEFAHNAMGAVIRECMVANGCFDY
jgi:hypothetical protein